MTHRSVYKRSMGRLLLSLMALWGPVLSGCRGGDRGAEAPSDIPPDSQGASPVAPEVAEGARPSSRSPRTEPPSARQIYEGMLTYFDPTLLLQAEERGLYDRERYPVFRDVNPFFIRGDFNGDGAMDLAFWVMERATGSRGVAILHSTLDTLYLFGAGRPGPPPHGVMSNEGRVDTWHLLPVGHVESSPYGTIPEIGLEEGRPFTFERETLEFVFLGKSAFVFYWAEGQYWEFWTAD